MKQNIRKIFQNSKKKKKEIDEYLTKLVRILNKKEKHPHHDRDNPDYYGIRDMRKCIQ